MNKILIVNQVFFPDEVAVSQYVSSLAFELIRKKYIQISVVAGIRDYENPKIKYSTHSTEAGVSIERLWSTGYSKRNKIGRFFNFFTFQIALIFKLVQLKRDKFDLVIGCTVPPLVPVVTAIACFLHRLPYVYWIMDLQPDEAVAAGYISKPSITEKILRKVSMLPLNIAKSIIVLDRFMKDRLCNMNVSQEKIATIGLWPMLESKEVADSVEGFRNEFGFGKKKVIMYSGNHSVCHPLDTLLQAILYLKDDSRFLFVFVGSGVRKKDVTDFSERHRLTNIIQLPYQPLSRIGESLASADIHIVIQGDLFSGLVHPSKIYGILACGKPFIYIGPKEGHISDIINSCKCGIHIRHGDKIKCVDAIERYTKLTSESLALQKQTMQKYVTETFNKQKQIDAFSTIIGGVQ